MLAVPVVSVRPVRSCPNTPFRSLKREIYEGDDESAEIDAEYQLQDILDVYDQGLACINLSNERTGEIRLYYLRQAVNYFGQAHMLMQMLPTTFALRPACRYWYEEIAADLADARAALKAVE
jgi:hypothetical protein